MINENLKLILNKSFNIQCKEKEKYLYILELLLRLRNFFHEQQMRSIPAYI